MPRKIGLSMKAAVLIAMVTAATSIAVGLASFFSAAATAHGESTRFLNTVAQAKRDHVKDYIDMTSNDVASISDSAIVKLSLSGFAAASKADGQEKFDRLISIVTAGSVQDRMDLADFKDGSVYSQIHKGIHPEFVKIASIRGYYDFIIVDDAGKIIYTMRKTKIFGQKLEADASDEALRKIEELYKRVQESKEPADVQFADFSKPDGDEPLMAYFGVPIVNKGKKVATFIAAITPARLEAILAQDATAAEATLTYLANGAGVAITGDSPIALNAGQNGDTAAVDVASHDGVDYQWASAPLDAMGSEWRIVSAQAVEQIEAPVTALKYQIAAISLLSVGITALIGIVLTKGMIGILSALGRSMSELAEGNLDIEIKGSQRNDEIGDMARALAILQETSRSKVTLEESSAADREAFDADRKTREQLREAEVVETMRAVDEIAEGLKDLATGNLRSHIANPFTGDLDRMRVDFNRTVSQLNDTLVRVRSNSERIKDSVREIDQSAKDLSHRTETQAVTLERNSQVVETISTSARSNLSQTFRAQDLADSAKNEAEQTKAVVLEAVDAMQSIERASNEIGGIVEIIDQIAMQTNLLALNAGVEAARAGSAGKGFAVVANEVRELSQRSAGAAHEIRSLIDKSTHQIESGVLLVRKAGNVMEKISEQTAEISSTIKAIAEATRQQTDEISGVNTGFGDLLHFTMQNTAMVEETTAIVSQLVETASELNEVIEQFRITEPARTEAAQPLRAQGRL